MSAFHSLFKPLSRGVAVILASLPVAPFPVAVAAEAGVESTVAEANSLLVDEMVKKPGGTAASGGEGEVGESGVAWGPRPVLTSLSRFLTEALRGAELAPHEGSGFWYRALASGAFAPPAGVAMEEPILTNPQAVASDSEDPLVRLLTTPLRGIAGHLDSDQETGPGVSWRMRYGRPSELGRGHSWRSGEGDTLFDEDGSLEPAPAVGVQMNLNW